MHTAEKARFLGRLRTGAVFFFITATSLAAMAQHLPPPTPQETPPPSTVEPPLPPGEDNGLPRGMQTSQAARKSQSEIQAEQQAQLDARRRAFIREHYQHLRRDVDKLLDLANEFKEYGDNNPKGVPATEMVKKIRQMEDVSHDLRKLMYSQNVPHVKSSGTGLVIRGPNPGTGAPGASGPTLQRAGGLCLELATHLDDRMYAYLEQTNEHTVSAGKQISAAYDVVHTAAKLEGLAYELRSAGILRDSP